MGLDMHLLRETYVKNSKYMRPEHRYEVIVKQGGNIVPDIEPARICGIVEQVAYWRGAHVIHLWFITNVQNGKDSSGQVYVEKEQLTQLVNLCRQVADNPQQISEILLPHIGKYFRASDLADPEVRDFHLHTIENTITMVAPLLEIPDDPAEYWYDACW